MHFRIDLTLPYLALTGQYGSASSWRERPTRSVLPSARICSQYSGIAQRVAGDHRDPDDLLDRLGGVGRPALRVVHRVEPGARALLHAHRQVDRRAAGPLEHPRDLDALLRAAAARAPLVERVAHEDREALAALLLDRVDDRQREAHPVLEAAAEAVGAHVEERAHELGQQVAVRGVQLHRVEAGLLHPPGGLAEQIDQLEDLGDRGRPDLLALLLGVLVDDLVAGGPGQLQDAVGRAQGVVARDRALAAGCWSWTAHLAP